MVVQGRQSINSWHLGNNIFGHSKENLMMHLQRRFGVRNTTSLFVRFFSRPRASSAMKSLENRGAEWKSQQRSRRQKENWESFCREWEPSVPRSWLAWNWFAKAKRSPLAR